MLTPLQHATLALSILLPLLAALLWWQLSDMRPLAVIIALPAIPALIAYLYRKPHLAHAWLLWAAFISIALVALNVWSHLLSGTAPPLSVHALVLLLAVCLCANLQMYGLQFGRARRTDANAHQAAYAPSLLLALMWALVINSLLLIALDTTDIAALAWVETKFLERGIIPPLTALLFLWGAVLLTWRALLVYQHMVRRTPDALSESPVEPSEPTRRNAVLDALWGHLENFYNVPKYINWSMPILGFIGTVLGISMATEGLSGLLGETSGDFANLLSSALAPLGIAFDTTLIALSLSVVLMLAQTLLYRWEEARLMHFERLYRYSEATITQLDTPTSNTSGNAETTALPQA